MLSLDPSRGPKENRDPPEVGVAMETHRRAIARPATEGVASQHALRWDWLSSHRSLAFCSVVEAPAPTESAIATTGKAGSIHPGSAWMKPPWPTLAASECPTAT